ncbi:zinc ion binding [Halocaridina rubra]|uniref:Zinc ion binding n=1 Tax=Halocaridina rubra TaxID=373956 RepID=A0AAN8WJ96_HALRR
MSFLEEDRIMDRSTTRHRASEEGISPVLSPAICQSPSNDHYPSSSVILSSSWACSPDMGSTELRPHLQHHPLSPPVLQLPNPGSVSSSASSNHVTITSIGGLQEECTEVCGNGGVDLQQPWYTCLYSPPSLQQSPLQDLVDGPLMSDSEGQFLHTATAHGPPYSSTTSVSSVYSSELPSHSLPLTLKVEDGRHDEVMADVLSLDPSSGVPNSVGGGIIDCEGARIEDYRLGNSIRAPEEGCLNLMAANNSSSWMVEEEVGAPWPTVKVEAWNNPHCRYVNEEGTYWLPSGWQMSSSGIMEGSIGSPGEEQVASPQDGASTSGGKRPDSKKCGVCGDRALGYNFNAITCESCKAFFRRNALKNKEFRCPFQDSCKVDQVTRRFCQKCRLRKCFEIGMKKEWIMTDEEKQKKKQKIEENRARKMGDAYSDDDSMRSSTAAFSPFNGSVTEASKPQAVVVGIIRNEDETSAKVLKADGQTDIHSQDRSIIQTIGTATGKLPVPSTLLSDCSKDETDYASDYTGSPPGSQQETVPSHTEEEEFSTGGLLSHPTTTVLQIMPHSHITSPTLTTTTHTITPTTGAEGLISSPLPNNIVFNTSSPGSAGQTHVPSPPASTSNPGHAGINMAQMMAINIKKEVEYADSDITQSPPTDTRDESEPAKDGWDNFSVQDALRILQPGCKNELNVTGISMMDTIMNTAITAEYSAFSLLGSSNPRELNEPEKMKLSELSEANKGLMAPLCEDYNFKDLSNPSLINIINLTEIAIRRLIKMSKRISAFKSLCQEDQIALLKGGCTEMMILRSVFAYDPDKDSWTIQQDHDRFKNIKLKVLKAAPGNVYEEHKRFILAFQPEWRRDLNIIFLLSAITLFTPERPNIIHAEAIKHEQCCYLYLLKRYLECKYGGCEGRTVYHKLLERINHLHILNENHIRVFLEVNPQEVEPLLIEIFDLKQR